MRLIGARVPAATLASPRPHPHGPARSAPALSASRPRPFPPATFRQTAALSPCRSRRSSSRGLSRWASWEGVGHEALGDQPSNGGVQRARDGALPQGAGDGALAQRTGDQRALGRSAKGTHLRSREGDHPKIAMFSPPDCAGWAVTRCGPRGLPRGSGHGSQRRSSLEEAHRTGWLSWTSPRHRCGREGPGAGDRHRARTRHGPGARRGARPGGGVARSRRSDWSLRRPAGRLPPLPDSAGGAGRDGKPA